MHKTYSLYLLQHVSADLYGHQHVVLQIRKNESILVTAPPPFTDIKYDILLSWLLLQIIE
jgi:hypothetical protein